MAVKEGDVVTVDYEGKLDDGEVFDSSKHGDDSHPLAFKVGSKTVIEGFEKAVVGMEIGEEKEFRVEAADAYGEATPDMMQKVPVTSFPPEHPPEKGMMFMVPLPDGNQIPATVVEVDGEEATIDLNHPLAGKPLTFTVKVVNIGKDDCASGCSSCSSCS